MVLVRLLLIRHAEPEANVAGIVAGPKGCTGLTERGRGQAAALAGRLRMEASQVDFLYSSILPRAVETAEIVRPAVGAPRSSRTASSASYIPASVTG